MTRGSRRGEPPGWFRVADARPERSAGPGCIRSGGAMASVEVDVTGGGLTAAITKDAVEAPGLSAGSSVVALIKSTEISLATA
ncbi:TOBE domain-containing protein [Streptomyces sp. NPDC056387]|uniref:TOBE domain-containing protein n=1 Tax=Streptomyces sp. NPDC056387 TaxID=3345803 RepID=UPI0035DFE278